MRRSPSRSIECHGGREVPGGQRYLVQIHRAHPVSDGLQRSGRRGGSTGVGRRATRYDPPMTARARLLSVNVGLPRDIAVEGPHRAHRDLEGSGPGPLPGGPAQPRRRRPGRPGRARGRATRRLRLPDRVVSLLGGAARPDRPRAAGSSARTSPSKACPTTTVCIGDRYRIGTALFEVTQPRVTCYRVGIRMNEPRMPALLTSQRPAGVLLPRAGGGRGRRRRRHRQGRRRPGADDRRGDQRAALFARIIRASGCERALRIPALSPGWRASFEALLQSRATARTRQRRARAGRGRAPGRSRVSLARVTAIDRESGGRRLARRCEPRRPAAADARCRASTSSCGCRPGDGGRRSFAAIRSPARLDRALPHQRQGRAARRGREPTCTTASAWATVSTSARRAARFVLGDGRAAGRAAQRGDRRDAGDGDAVRPGGRAHGAAGRVAPRGSRRAAASVRRRGRRLMRGTRPRPQLGVLQQRRARPTTIGRRLRRSGHLSRTVLERLGIPRDADFYLCGPARFMAEMREVLAALGVAPSGFTPSSSTGTSR